MTDPEGEEEFQLAPLDISNVWHRMGVVRLEAKHFEEAEVLPTFSPRCLSQLLSSWRGGATNENLMQQDLFEKSLSIRESIVGTDDILCKKSRVWLRRCRRERAAAAAVSDTLNSRHLDRCVLHAARAHLGLCHWQPR